MALEQNTGVKPSGDFAAKAVCSASLMSEMSCCVISRISFLLCFKVQIYKQAIPRMAQIIAALEDCVVTEGWHESWKAGPMPKMAAEVMDYFRARAGGARENAAKEAKVNAFVANCGQSLDWIFDGNPRGLICKAAGNSP